MIEIEVVPGQKQFHMNLLKGRFEFRFFFKRRFDVFRRQKAALI